MSVCLRKFTKSWLLAISLLLFFAGIIVAPSTLYPQTRTAENSGAVTADQQKQLTHLEQLSDQLQKDRDSVNSAVSQHGWDSDEADAAQQHLLQDRQEHRSLRRSLQAAGVAVPSDVTGTTAACQSTQSSRCCHNGHGHHGCCNHDGHCGDHCCGNH